VTLPPDGITFTPLPVKKRINIMNYPFHGALLSFIISISHFSLSAVPPVPPTLF
jgi:hypothetical protein